MDRHRVARQAGLLVAAFAATFALLVGGRAVIGRLGSGAPAASTPPSTGPSIAILPTPAASSALPPTADPEASDAPTVVITGAGDIADCSLDGAKRTSDLLVQQQGWFFTAGDGAYPDGSAANYGDCYAPTWGRVLDRTILPAPGNHDWVTKDAAGYLGYFGAKAAPNSVTWYSTTIGTWHVVVLDSDCEDVGGCDTDSPQGRWLAADLRASAAHCTLAIWHQPRFSSGLHGDDPAVAPFWELLHDAHAELVINGHDHDYERFAPLAPDGSVERPGGLREIVVGTGGAQLRSFTHAAPGSEFRLSGTYGVLRLTLHPFNYDWEFLPASGDVADSGSTACR